MNRNITKNKKLPFRLALFTVLVTAIFFITFLVSSCRIQGEKEEVIIPTQDETEEVIEEDTEDDIEGVEIAVWNSVGPRERMALVKSIDNFMDENPAIKIEIRNFRSQEELEDQFEAASLAGSGPELLLTSMDGVQRLAPENVIKEIRDEVDYLKILDGLVEISQYDGKNYIVPVRSTDFLVLFYNKDLIESVPPDFNSIIEYCREVNDFDEQIYGFLLNGKEADWIIPFIGGYSEWIIDYATYSLTLDTKSTEKTLNFLHYIYVEEEILPYNISYEEIDFLFRSGNVSMIINGSWAIDEYREAGLNFDIAKIPRVWGVGKDPTPMISGLGLMVNINCYGEKLEAAKKFINYMLSDEIQISWTMDTQTFPVLKNIDNNLEIANDSLFYNAFQQAKISRGKPYNDLIRVIRDSIRINVENVIMGNIGTEEAVPKIQEDAIKLRSGSITVEELREETLE